MYSVTHLCLIVLAYGLAIYLYYRYLNRKYRGLTRIRTPYTYKVLPGGCVELVERHGQGTTSRVWYYYDLDRLNQALLKWQPGFSTEPEGWFKTIQSSGDSSQTRYRLESLPEFEWSDETQEHDVKVRFREVFKRVPEW